MKTASVNFIECLIFDLGNVVAFFDHGLACRRLAKLTARTAMNENDIRNAIFDSGLEEQYDRGKITTERFLKELRQRLNIRGKPDDRLVSAWSNIFQPNDAVIELVAKLHEDCAYRLVLASNTNELHYRKFRQDFPDILKYFDHTVLSYEIGHRKPDGGFFKQCIEAARCEPSHCVYVDDRADFVEIAHQLGMRSVVYRRESQLGRSLQSLGVKIVPVVKPNADLDGNEKDIAIQIYQQKYLQYRHFDTLRWQVPGLVTTLGVLILSLGVEKSSLVTRILRLGTERHSPVLASLLVGYGIFALLCCYFLHRITHHQLLNSDALQRIARRLGDFAVPSRASKKDSAARKFQVLICFIGAASLIAGIGLLVVWLKDWLQDWS